MIHTIVMSFVVPLAESFVLALILARFYRRRHFDKGFEAGSEASAQASGVLIRDLLWLLRSKGATRAEVDAVFSQTGCGRPTCKACAKRPNVTRTN